MTDRSAIQVDIVSDVVCPWCVIGYRQLAVASRETSIPLDVHWHPFELNPQMPEEGQNLREHLAAKYGTTLEGSKQARARLTEMGAVLDFTFDYADDMHMWNTFRAHQLIDWADEQGRGHDMKQALFVAYFTHRKNVSDVEVLADIAAELGLDQAEALRVVSSDERAEKVRQKQGFWASRGIQSVPAMIFERQHLLSGAQGAENYGSVLRQLRAAQAA
ncbi:MAG: DsbA family oxidoreductase [Pseudomonadota bacterium]